MRTVEIQLYKFDELSDVAKEKAIDAFRYADTEIHWTDENKATLYAFEKVFPVKIKEWSYGGRGEGVYFEFTESDEVEELSGQRLATYIWNNYFHDLFKPKYLKTLDREVKSRAFKITYFKNHEGKVFSQIHSKLRIENSCVLTGYYLDDNILKPVCEFLKKPDERNFRDLMEECFSAWVEACNADIDYQNSDEYIIEEIKANDYEFTEDGEMQ